MFSGLKYMIFSVRKLLLLFSRAIQTFFGHFNWVLNVKGAPLSTKEHIFTIKFTLCYPVTIKSDDLNIPKAHDLPAIANAPQLFI